MPFASIKLNPGVNTVATPSLNEAGISSCNLIRFRSGLVEKLGGWVKYIGVAMGSITKSLHSWRDLSSNDLLGVGSLTSLKAISNNNTVSDITPLNLTSNVTLDLSTVKGSNIINVIDTNINNLTQYTAVFFNTPISIGGLILGGMYQLLPTPSGTAYTFYAETFATSTVSNAGAVPVFTTLIDTPVVTVTLADHALRDGDSFTFPVNTIVGGINITGTYRPIRTISDTQFEIVSGTPAISTATVSMNSGLAGYLYLIANAPNSGYTFYRFGAPPAAIGEYALGQGFSIMRTNPVQAGTAITAYDWTMDNWGEILLACPRGGAIWYWALTDGFQTAVPVGNGPPFNNGIFIAMPAQILVCWGSTRTIHRGQSDASNDPLIVRWSDQLDFTEWDVTSRTQAGSFHIPTGSEIRGGIQGATQAYIFTDSDAWSMQYMGPPLVFSFNQIGTGCGLIGPHAVTNMFGKTYWMSESNFFVTGGSGVTSIPCTVWDTVFYDLDTSASTKCVAAANSKFSEIFFFYPSISGATGECDKYVKLNVAEGEWDYGTMGRSAWTDESILGYPIGADPATTNLQQHETGYSADGAEMGEFFETGYAAYGDGENFGVIDYFEPDFIWQGASPGLSLTLTAARSPNGPTMSSGPFSVNSTTYYMSPRLRGRQLKWRGGGSGITDFWRIGNVRYRYGIDGRR